MEEMTGMVELNDVAERMEAAAVAMEAAATKMAEAQERFADEAQERVTRIVATVENEREMELVRRLEAAEAKIAELQGGGAGASGAGRKTAHGAAAMVAKHGIALENVEAASIDAALASLTIEQRIAVKAELLRAGVIR